MPRCYDYQHPVMTTFFDACESTLGLPRAANPGLQKLWMQDVIKEQLTVLPSPRILFAISSASEAT